MWHKLIERKRGSHAVGTSVLIWIRKSNCTKNSSGEKEKHMLLIVWGECVYEKTGVPRH